MPNEIIKRYVELTGAMLMKGLDGKGWRVILPEDTYEYDTLEDMVKDMKYTLSELEKEHVE